MVLFSHNEVYVLLFYEVHNVFYGLIYYREILWTITSLNLKSTTL